MRRSSEIALATVFSSFLILLMLTEWLRRIEFASPAIQSLQADVIEIALSKSTQIPLAIALVVYFIGLFGIVIRRRQNSEGSIALWKKLTLADVCKIGLVLLALAACLPAWTRGETGSVGNLKLGIDQTTNALVLLTGIVVGCAAEALIGTGADMSRIIRRVVLVAIPLFLAATSPFQPAVPHIYKYHDAVRWTGLWVNPNTYGLLMGAGLVLAIGQVPWKRIGWKTSQRVEFIFLVMAAVLCGFGLLKSYSRGAWLATSCALMVLLWFRASQKLRRNLIPIALIILSGFAFGFWNFRYAESPLARRLFSVANRNDFSWRNRVTVWRGSIQMMRDRPLLGFGWGDVESAYERSYRARRLDESMAIQLNDYFTLANSAGVPALMFFIGFAALSLRRQTKPDASFSPHQSSARASAVLLLIGFWFDGGLFKVATGPLFWTLIEFSRTTTIPAASLPKDVVHREKLRRSEMVLRMIAGLLTLAAATSTAMHVIVPRLAITSGRVSFARKHLVPPKALADFDFLMRQPIWRGQPVRVLLDHAELANYNRSLVEWKLEEEIYRKFVLSPQIDPQFDADPAWRRPLWEYFYPRIRRQTDIEAAAQQTFQKLRNQITPGSGGSASICEMWRSQSASEPGFEALCVGVWRSIGIPARLNVQRHAEYLSGSEWRSVPQADDTQ
jgi:O-antigen ligase